MERTKREQGREKLFAPQQQLLSWAACWMPGVWKKEQRDSRSVVTGGLTTVGS